MWFHQWRAIQLPKSFHCHYDGCLENRYFQTIVRLTKNSFLFIYSYILCSFHRFRYEFNVAWHPLSRLSQGLNFPGGGPPDPPFGRGHPSHTHSNTFGAIVLHLHFWHFWNTTQIKSWLVNWSILSLWLWPLAAMMKMLPNFSRIHQSLHLNAIRVGHLIGYCVPMNHNYRVQGSVLSYQWEI